MWSKRRNAEVSRTICYETGKLLIPAKSLKSRHTSRRCFNFSPPQKKKKNTSGEEKAASALAGKIFPGSFVARITGNISRGSIKASCSAVDSVGSPSWLPGDVNHCSEVGGASRKQATAEFSCKSRVLTPGCISCCGNGP